MVKEAITLSESFFEVKVIYCPMSPWGDDFDMRVFNENPQISWIRVGAHPINDRFNYFFTRLRRKIWEIVYALFGDVCNSALKSSVLYSQELGKEAMKHIADLYIGHNLGSIHAVIKAATKHYAISSFDFEDYHRGEDVIESPHFQKVKIIEDQFVNKLNFASSASPLISLAYSQIYPHLFLETINNYFPIKYQSLNKIKPEFSIKLFWFSQYIGKKRGIEQIIEAVGLLKEFDVKLTLLGNIKEDEKEYFEFLINKHEIDNSKINFMNPVEEKRIFEIASEHHIGFASETGKDFNNNIALSNKIFTYLLAGNAILLSNTQAQKLFYEANPNIGYLYSQSNSLELANLIKRYILDPKILFEHRVNSLKLSNKLNWENESEKLLKLIKSSF
jgi:hypothetical protein